jgi:AcrR family transcriptional regulator
MNKYEIRTANKKAAIMKATISLINEKGFSATCIKQIASCAGVSPVSIYNYYGSKEKLVLECAKAIISENFASARRILDSELPYEEKIKTALSLCSDDRAVSMSKYFSSTSLAEKSFNKILCEGCREIKRELYQDFIELGKKEQVIDSSIPTQTILKFMDSLNDIPLNEAYLKNEIQDLHKLFLYGLLGNSPLSAKKAP